ncbi:MAG: Fur family transcriptional regulator [Lepagella sp.]
MAVKGYNGDIARLLEEAGLRTTPVRVLVLKELLSASHPMSGKELEDRLDTVDRSSISRTMVHFAEHGLVHQISDGSGSMKYEICHSSEHTYRHSDEHPHFHCRECGETICLPQVPVPDTKLPEGYIGENISYIITGLCAKCQTKI